MDYIDVMLQKADDNIKAIRAIYADARKDTPVPTELLYLVKKTIEDQMSGLDATAFRVKELYLKSGGRSPYFPITTVPADFPLELERQLKGLMSSEPHIAAAFERHQPYHAGKEPLQHIRALARVNKHRDFTVQVREESPYRAFFVDGTPILVMDAQGIKVGGGRPPQGFVTEEYWFPWPPFELVDAVVSDWRFVDPPVWVVQTLEAIQQIVRAATDDVRHVAAL